MSAPTDKAIQLATAIAVYEGIMKAYNIYTKVRGFLEEAPTLMDQLEAARAPIFDEMNRIHLQGLAADFNARVAAYGEIVRNPYHPATIPRLNSWMTDSQNLFEQLRAVLANAHVGADSRSIENAYVVAPAFNAIAALRVSVLGGIPELNYPALDPVSITEVLRRIEETNYRLVGAIQGQSDGYGSVAPFWGSAFWRSSKFAGDTYVCEQVVCEEDGGRWTTPKTCSLLSSSCYYNCHANDSLDGPDPGCINPRMDQVYSNFVNDPVISVIRIGLARAVQTLNDYRIWDPNWGWLTIIEA